MCRSNHDTVAERLRRLTRNQLGLSRVGSSPAGVAFYLFLLFFLRRYIYYAIEKHENSHILRNRETRKNTRCLLPTSLGRSAESVHCRQ
jgi:hypothetical protein